MAAMALVTCERQACGCRNATCKWPATQELRAAWRGLMGTGRLGQWRPVCGELSEGYARGQVSREAWSAMFVMLGLVHQEHR
jgi:hypothetical protein